MIKNNYYKLPKHIFTSRLLIISFSGIPKNLNHNTKKSYNRCQQHPTYFETFEKHERTERLKAVVEIFKRYN